MRLNPLFSCLAGALVLSLGQVSAGNAQAALPDPAVEARVARKLLAVEPRISKPSRGSDTDLPLANIATALARLGRLEAALKVVGQMALQDADAFNGAPYTRAEVLRLVVRRRCMAGKLEEARLLIPAIAVPRLRADALLALSRAHWRRGEMELARRTLYLVSPLVENDIRATSYTAYLLSKSGDLDGAKRLFARAQKRLASLKSPKSAASKEWDRDVILAQNERSSLAWYLFKAGLIDEAVEIKESAREGQAKDRFLPVFSPEELARVNRFDDALRVAREVGGYRGVSSLAYLAFMLDKRNRDREGALKVLAEAEAEYRRLSLESNEEMKSLDEGLKGFTMQVIAAVLCASIAHELGQEERAQQWLGEAVKGLEPETEATMRIYMAIFSLGMTEQEGWGIPRGRLEQIDAEVKAQIPKLKNSGPGYDLCRFLIRAYMKVGQLEAASYYLTALERITLAENVAEGNMNIYHRLIEIARNWRELGNEEQVKRLLAKIDGISLPAGSTRHDVARVMISNGFVDEGRARLATLPVKNPNWFALHDIATWEARYQPHVFPARIAQISNLQVRLHELINFTNGLTAPIYEAPQEREVVLSAGGYS